MKLFLMFLPLLTYVIHTQSQPISYFEIRDAINFDENKTSTVEYEKWYAKLGSDYFIVFKQNTIGVKKAIELAQSICSNNNFDFNRPTYDNSYLASYVKNLGDYERINTSVSLGSSIIEKYWTRETVGTLSGGIVKSRLELVLDEKKYRIRIINN